MELLGIMVKNDPNCQNSDMVKRFIVPVSTHRDVIARRIRNLRPDQHIYVNERRHSCFGQALNISSPWQKCPPLPLEWYILLATRAQLDPGWQSAPISRSKCDHRKNWVRVRTSSILLLPKITMTLLPSEWLVAILFLTFLSSPPTKLDFLKWVTCS